MEKLSPQEEYPKNNDITIIINRHQRPWILNCPLGKVNYFKDIQRLTAPKTTRAFLSRSEKWHPGFSGMPLDCPIFIPVQDSHSPHWKHPASDAASVQHAARPHVLPVPRSLFACEHDALQVRYPPGSTGRQSRFPSGL
jgi:hypothetical protein